MKIIEGYDKKILLLSAIFLMTFCTTDNLNEDIYWVNSYKAACEGVGSRQCLQVQKGDTVDSKNWELFYSSIKDFEYDPCYIYKLRVIEEQIPGDEVPADGSSIKYTLAKVLINKEIPPYKLMIFGLWNVLKMKK